MRSDIVKRGIIILIVGIVLGGLFYAEVGSVLFIVGLGYLIYGLVKSPESAYPDQAPPRPSYTPPPPSYAGARAVPPPPPGARPRRQFCTNCGQPISADIKFCGNCGTPVT